MADTRDDSPVVATTSNQAIATEEELPVVARLVVEVRSDGKRTVARGAMEDAATGMKAAIEAQGSSPLELALALAKSMLQVPVFTAEAVRSRIRRLLP
jgi:ribosomal protein S7